MIMAKISTLILNLSLFFGSTLAFSKDSNIQDLAFDGAQRSSSVEIVSTYEPSPISLSDSMKQVLKVMSDVEKLPSCNKIASASLLNSCSALDGTESPSSEDIIRGPDVLLDEAKSIYAARLAVCELDGAKASVPVACRHFLPTDRTSQKTGIRGWITRNGPSKSTDRYEHYERVTEESLDQCLAALETRPQWWTSYSNARQNAVVMCHAMRSEVEKDEQLHLSKVLASVTLDVAGELAGSRRQFQALREDFLQTKQKIHQFHLNLYDDQKEMRAKIQRLWGSILSGAQEGADTLKEDLYEILRTAKDAGKEMAVNTDRVGEAFDETTRKIADLELAHRVQTDELLKDSAGVAELLEYMKEMIKQELLQELSRVTNGLQHMGGIAIYNNGLMHQHGLSLTDANGQIAALGQRVSEFDRGLERMHVEQIRRDLESQKSANKTMETIEVARESAEEMSYTLNVLADVVKNGWTGILKYLATRVAIFVIASLFGFAFCNQMNVAKLSAVTIAIATGLIGVWVYTTHGEELRVTASQFRRVKMYWFYWSALLPASVLLLLRICFPWLRQALRWRTTRRTMQEDRAEKGSLDLGKARTESTLQSSCSGPYVVSENEDKANPLRGKKDRKPIARPPGFYGLPINYRRTLTNPEHH